MTTQEILQAAQTARMPLALADADTKNAALEAMAVALIAAKDAILDANAKDLAAARGRVSDVMLDRLALTPSRLTDMAKGMREVAALPDPVGAVLRRIVRPNGLVIEKTAVPMGVIAIIYESRPNESRQRLHPALRPRCLGQLPRHCGGPARRSAQSPPARNGSEPDRGYEPRQRQRVDDR